MPYNHPIPSAPVAPSMLPRAAADLTSQDAPNILNFACRSRRGDHDVWVSENIVEQIGFIKVAGKVYLRLFNSSTAYSGERLYYAPTISFPATYFSGA